MMICTHHTTCKTTSHQGEPDEQEQPRPPHGPRVSESFISPYTVFIDQIHDQHAKEGANSGDPVDEGNVNGRRKIDLAIRRMSVCRQDDGVEERPVRKRKLQYGVA